MDIRAPEHHSAFGPCVDGIVVAREPHVLMEEHAMAQFKSYDVMFGVTSIEVMYTCIYCISSSICVCYVCKSVLYCQTLAFRGIKEGHEKLVCNDVQVHPCTASIQNNFCIV